MDISQVPELVNKEGYPLMIDSYDSVERIVPRIFRVESLTDDLLYGDKGSVITGMGQPVNREDKEHFTLDEFRSAYTWYMQTQQWGLAFEISDRMVRASGGVGRIRRLVQEQSRSFGENTALKKEQWVADFLQQGTLTAGNAQYFDGSFPDNADPYPKFIYDGLPLFDTAHPLTIGSDTFANHFPSRALTHDNLQTTYNTMRSTNNVDERGNKIRLRPDTLVVPTSMELTARTLVESINKPGGANNDVNIHRGRFEVIPWEFLDDTASASAWWLGQKLSDSIVVYDAGQPVIDMDYDKKRKTWTITMETHFGVTCRNWRHWSCNNKAAS